MQRVMLCLYACTLLTGTVGCIGTQRGPIGERKNIWPTMATLSHKDATLPDGVDPEYPENFDWQGYIAEGHSTINEMNRADQACAVLWKRLLAVEDRERESRLKFGGKEHVEYFNDMQEQWRKLCALECRDYAGPSTEWRGSGWKARLPSFVAQQIHERILYLNYER